MTQGRNNPDGTYLKPKTIEQIDFPNNPLPYFPNDVQHATRWNLLIDAINAVRFDAIGESNTLSNRGLTGVGLVEPKVDADLGARSVTAGTGISVTLDAPNKTVIISNTAPESTGGSLSGDSYPAGLIADWDPAGLLGSVGSGAYSSFVPDVVGAYSASWGTPAQWPQFVKNVVNGYPVLRFSSGRGDRLVTPSIINPSLGSTWLFLLQRSGSLIEHSVYATWPNAADLATGGEDSAEIIHEESGDAGNIYHTSVVVGSGATLDTPFRLILAIDSATVCRAYFNGVLTGTYNPGSTLNTLKGLKFGQWPVSGGGGTANFDLIRAQAYNLPLIPSDVTDLDDQIATQYGL